MSRASADGGLSARAMVCMFLLALQFGVQPILSSRFTPDSVNRSSVILVQESIKFFFALTMLVGGGEFRAAVSGWSFGSWLRVAGLPAALYVVQNLASLLAYQNLDALTFCVLNQTKTLSAALCCYVVIGKRQSKAQVGALLLLTASALVIERIVTIDGLLGGNDDATPSSKNEDEEEASATHLARGVLPVLLASFLSGLAGALSQKNLQGEGGRNSYLFTMELCVASVLFLGASLSRSDDGASIAENGFFHNWSLDTSIPIVVNAAGGILVGLVTKYAGSVRKGFALIFGLLLSGVLQQRLGDGDGGLTKEQIVGGAMASLSMWIHTTHPYAPPPKQQRVKTD